MFCPNEIAWGDVATWISGIGTFTAAFVAVYIASYSARQTKILENEIRKNAAMAYSIAIHADLVPLSGVLKLLILFNSQFGRNMTIDQFDELRSLAERINAPALDRFLDRIDVFEPKIAGQLLLVFRGIVNIQNVIRTPIIDGDPLTEARVRTAMQSVARLAQLSERWVYDAMDSMAVLAREAGFEVISTNEIKNATIDAVNSSN